MSGIETDPVTIARHAGPVFGALLLGVSVGIVAIGGQLPSTCAVAAIETDRVCQALAWGDTWALRAALGGFGLFGAAFVAEYYRQE